MTGEGRNKKIRVAFRLINEQNKKIRENFYDIRSIYDLCAYFSEVKNIQK